MELLTVHITVQHRKPKQRLRLEAAAAEAPARRQRATKRRQQGPDLTGGVQKRVRVCVRLWECVCV